MLLHSSLRRGNTSTPAKDSGSMGLGPQPNRAKGGEPRLREAGPLVVLGDEIHAARTARKVYTSSSA